jgi:hypothetical protein
MKAFKIIYPRLVSFLGRNGHFKAKGLNVEQITEEVIELTPITSRDQYGRCEIQVPSQCIPLLIDKLLQFYPAVNYWEIRDDTGTIKSGSKEKIEKVWDSLTLSDAEVMSKYDMDSSQAEYFKVRYQPAYQGNPELIEIHAIKKN